MSSAVKLAVAGVGNNISALYQGVSYYRQMCASGRTEEASYGIRKTVIGDINVFDVEFVAAYDVSQTKVDKPFTEAVLAAPNNYPILDVDLAQYSFKVEHGFTSHTADSDLAMAHVVKSLRDSGAEVLLYSLPTGLQWAAELYAKAALMAGVAFVNCTPESIARMPELLAQFEGAGIPCVGDDLASHLGASIVHRSLLQLFGERGITLDSSYQLNFGGNEDFRNLRDHGASKGESKINALRQEGLDTSKVHIIPSAGYVSHLNDNKIAMINVEGLGWAGRPVSIDLKLKVQDSSNAAGVIIDLIRIAALAKRQKLGGFPLAAASCLKSPAVGHERYSKAQLEESFDRLCYGANVAAAQ
ncbi:MULTISPECIES: inositol-3-phosphate synthase [unclassified Rhizobium]|uniref:inositol-3-phosphate synthase n=1 Tax=unclassified Rhizobium TaxID=2613769 RepID=UPI001ADA7F93|nr:MULTISPECIES: inositol-3-phosphate synthase [unclassified Rhizobium]MBO9100946.1 inositol-3-phosphate synthase [Rhizobium sp. L58/93]MBO9136951.1 inositol-3-phosphate synthase [Rhizobium sp. B209b/85]MBO9170716.1 inositol-3-phosphate synthase [Rhizobium sp. L245/93]MBO9188193.1 inositol-3-phosphate synthase [Rhizobium sp. E27B/91]QXZ86173.1 inositol-3-phosphate synthase [Rhizobium sp. K1/93]